MPLALLLALIITLGVQGVAAGTEPTYNRVAFTESVSSSVETDELVIVMFAQAEGRNATQPADEVNRAIDWAVAIAEGHADLQMQTLGYQTHPVYKDGKIRGWRVRQSLRIEGTDPRLLGDLTGQLQAQLAVQSVDYRISDQRRREILTALTDIALKQFAERAQHMAATLGRQGYRLVSLTINDSAQRPPPVMRAMAAERRAEGAPAPASFEPGTQRLTLSVNGEIELTEE